MLQIVANRHLRFDGTGVRFASFGSGMQLLGRNGKETQKLACWPALQSTSAKTRLQSSPPFNIHGVTDQSKDTFFA
jgi:hypothetical protein